MLPGCVGGIRGVELLARGALVDTTDTEGKESLAIGSNEPGSFVPLLNRKRRSRDQGFGGGGRSAHAGRQREHSDGGEGGILQQWAKGEFETVHDRSKIEN